MDGVLLLVVCACFALSRAANFTVGQTFQIVLSNILDMSQPLTPNAAVWDIDLWDNDIATMSALKAMGKIVVCYFSAGTYEDWRSDASQFVSQDLGLGLALWPGERWLNISSPRVRAIMTSRIQLAKSKGCDAIDPDNTGIFGGRRCQNFSQIR